MSKTGEQMANDTLHEPPEGVLAGESVPRENEESEYNRLKHERVETLREQAERAEATLDTQEKNQ